MRKFAIWSPAGKGDGVIVGTDVTQEWLLPWWWEHYSEHNHHPVAFIDLGMSFEKKEWCKERGPLISLRMCNDFVIEKQDVDPTLANEWDGAYGRAFWESRGAWFQKPFACLKTPFVRTIWIDLDCEIRSSIESLFSFADSPAGVSMAREDTPYLLYNAGVIAFRHNTDLITEWALSCLEQTAHFRGDQEVFSHLVRVHGIAISEIPPLYNWSRLHNDHSHARILHWHGRNGKEFIKGRIHFSSLDF